MVELGAALMGRRLLLSLGIAKETRDCQGSLRLLTERGRCLSLSVTPIGNHLQHGLERVPLKLCLLIMLQEIQG